MEPDRIVSRELAAPWVELSRDGLDLLCRSELSDDLLRIYGRNRWVYDALSKRPQTMTLRGRRPVMAGMVGNTDIVVKRMYHGGILGGISRDAFLTSDRARAHVALDAYLTSHGITTAPALFVASRRVYGFVRAEVGFARIAGAVDADQYFFSSKSLPANWEERAAAIGQVIAQLHRVGFLHGDLNLMNFLFGPDGRIYILDLDKSTILPRNCSGADGSKNVDRLHRSILKQGRNHVHSQVERIISTVRSSYEHASARLATAHATVLGSDWASAIQDVPIP